VAVLSNADGGLARPGDIAAKAAAIAIGKPFTEYKEIMLPAPRVEALAGVYQIDAAETRTFRRDGERLVMQRSGRPPVTLSACSETGFFIPNSLTRIEFARDPRGQVTHVTVYQSDSAQINQRIGGAPPPRVAVRMDSGRFDAYAATVTSSRRSSCWR
jgi:hypothetical protein